MRSYGKMFRGTRGIYHAEQQEANVQKGKKLCPLCRCWKDTNEFIGADKLPRRYCQTCCANLKGKK